MIHKSSGVGIGSSGNFINQGTCQIAISGTVSTGIFVTTPFLNDTTGTITINSSIIMGSTPILHLPMSQIKEQ
ncbi:MAG: hypothetical protein IPF52_03080 [Saprospiraceae bacterium]|nr:hypothetical protein [Saprospiraceae bacterium]